MPRIFDNIELQLLPALRETLDVADRADFCVGYFNLRGWRRLASHIEDWTGDDEHCCRLLIGMQSLPQDELRGALTQADAAEMDNQTAQQLKRRLAEEFRQQLTIGAPSNEDEAGLRQLARQIRAGKVRVKLFLRHPLHAKLYLLFRPDPASPIVGFVGSSNLTLAGLARQGELNVDVLDGDSCQKLAEWFKARWEDRWCVDISDELAQIVGESWAREDLIPPYHIYLKMAYHLSQEARAGLAEFAIPRDFGERLFEFQRAAVKIAAHHLNKRGGVLIGDVVGLGKTLMATALARIFEDDFGLETLILCPANLVKMWEDYRDTYRLRGKVLSIEQVTTRLKDLRRYRLVIIDESHNLRNREGTRYRAIHEYISENESKCILLTATPYNKTYLDLSNQLRLFVPDDSDLGIRPEVLLRDLGETEFIRRHQCPTRSLAAFEKSEYADDWRELMRLYLVRRTRSFIQENYAETDPTNGRKYLTYEDGRRSYFPARVPRTVKFGVDVQYAGLYSDEVVDAINGLSLPRYGLGNYIAAESEEPPTDAEKTQLENLSKAGKRLMGFCRTNLFKRLESSGQAFLMSLERHILRNYVFLHAIETGGDIPIGTQDAALLDARLSDGDEDTARAAELDLFGADEPAEDNTAPTASGLPRTPDAFAKRAADIYAQYEAHSGRAFKWLRSTLFDEALAADLREDADSLLSVLRASGEWDAADDAKLGALTKLLTTDHANDKVIVFSQFADTVHYLADHLKEHGIDRLAGVTGDSGDPTAFAWRFSPVSNEKRDKVALDDELRVLVATDVLSEGQNLQDCSVVVNYDLPWAIIRLVQRAGRVDRIGQEAESIFCHSFLPAEGVEDIIRLRARVRQRLQDNGEVVGTDEAFFEDDRDNDALLDLYHEKAGILDGDIDGEVDLSSYAYQIWKNAVDKDSALEKTIPGLPAVTYSTRSYEPQEGKPEGALVYLRTAEDNDALAWIDRDKNSVTESQFAILRAAECDPETPALPRTDDHHDLVNSGVDLVAQEEKRIGGQLGRPSGARYRTYTRLMQHVDEVKDTLLDTPALRKAVQEIHDYPLLQSTVDTLNRQLRSGISDQELAELVLDLREDSRLCRVDDGMRAAGGPPNIICSMGLVAPQKDD